jgi:predicted MFS family arabinose efflux permease
MKPEYVHIKPNNITEESTCILERHFAMTLCVFVLIASEFMPVSLLTPLARDLAVTEGLAGQGIAISGTLAVLTSLTLSHIAGNINRKYLLLAMTALMAVSGIIIASAAAIWCIWQDAPRLVLRSAGSGQCPRQRLFVLYQPTVPRALAIFNGGNALATVIAAPWRTLVPLSDGVAHLCVWCQLQSWRSSGNGLACLT